MWSNGLRIGSLNLPPEEPEAKPNVIGQRSRFGQGQCTLVINDEQGPREAKSAPSEEDDSEPPPARVIYSLPQAKE